MERNTRTASVGPCTLTPVSRRRGSPRALRGQLGAGVCLMDGRSGRTHDTRRPRWVRGVVGRASRAGLSRLPRLRSAPHVARTDAPSDVGCARELRSRSYGTRLWRAGDNRCEGDLGHLGGQGSPLRRPEIRPLHAEVRAFPTQYQQHEAAAINAGRGPRAPDARGRHHSAGCRRPPGERCFHGARRTASSFNLTRRAAEERRRPVVRLPSFRKTALRPG